MPSKKKRSEPRGQPGGSGCLVSQPEHSSETHHCLLASCWWGGQSFMHSARLNPYTAVHHKCYGLKEDTGYSKSETHCSTHMFPLSNMLKSQSQNLCCSCINLFILHKGHVIDQSFKISIINTENKHKKQSIRMFDTKMKQFSSCYISRQIEKI